MVGAGAPAGTMLRGAGSPVIGRGGVGATRRLRGRPLPHGLPLALAAFVAAATVSTAAVAATGSARMPAVGRADYSATLDRLWDFEAPVDSAVRFRAERAARPPGSREALEAATQLARAQGLQGDFAGADALLDEVAGRLETQPTRLRVRYLLERGRVRNSSGAPARAVPLFHAALRAAPADGLPGAAFYRIDTLHMLGIAAPLAERADWNRRALAAAEAARDERARHWRGSLLNNSGWSAHERGDFTAALAFWERALAVRAADRDEAGTRIARWTVARGLRSVHRYAEAEAIQLALAAQTTHADAPDGFVYEELAELAALRHDDAAAQRWAQQAHALLAADPGFVASEPARLARLARLARPEGGMR